MIDRAPIDSSLRWVDDRLGRGQGRAHLPRQDLPRPLVVHAGGDRPVLVRGAAGHGRVPVACTTSPPPSTIIYHGSYLPLRGERVSEAYASTVGLSFDVRSGLLMRQAHHWAADIFLGSIAVHMARVFFTGAFRKPREFNWIVGMTMLILGIVNGFLGYSLPDDLVSGTGIRIAYSIIESIPLVGQLPGLLRVRGQLSRATG